MSPGAGHEAMFYPCKRPILARTEVRMSLRKEPTLTENKITGICASRGCSKGLAATAYRERTCAADLACTHPGTTVIISLESQNPGMGIRGSSFGKGSRRQRRRLALRLPINAWKEVLNPKDVKNEG